MSDTFHCTHFDDWRSTPCTKGANEHGCDVGRCHLIKGVQLPSGTAGSSAVPQPHEQGGRELTHELERRDLGTETPLPSIEVRPPPPFHEPKARKREQRLREHVLRNDGEVQSSLFLPEQLDLDKPDWRFTYIPSTGEASYKVTAQPPGDAPLLNLDAPNDAEVERTFDSIDAPPAPDVAEDGSIHTAGEEPDLQLLPPAFDAPRPPEALKPPIAPLEPEDPFGGLP